MLPNHRALYSADIRPVLELPYIGDAPRREEEIWSGGGEIAAF